MNSIVGLSIGNKIFYSILSEEPEFSNAGLSIIHILKNDRNKFMSDIIKSQDYIDIKYIYDEEFIFGEYISSCNSNIENIRNIMGKQDILDYVYIYDYESDLLLVKSPLSNIKAIDYKSSEDVSNYRKQHRDIDYRIEREI